MKDALEKAIPGIVVTSEKSTAPAFEVESLDDPKKVYHSKLRGGGSLDDDEEKLGAVTAAIKEDFSR